ncbi:LacI family DNA-binding transcriptional regulator [Actinomadura vinacea]|uniref:LacI family DNA-binding transcriptional regulator n=1 Tax=Actinomadura vinacea TaxID=115336 RepID=A0ABN3J5L3_9ACTN
MQNNRPATLITVAEAAGVSKTTASDALRGSGRVSEETRAAVQRAADALGYVPNGSARHLRRASTGTIGLYVPEVLTRSDYYMSFVFGVVATASDNDYDITLITSGRARPPRVDGLVLGDPLTGDPVVEELMNAGLPTVTCERFPGRARPDGVVWSRHADVVGDLLDHLAASGAERPALLVAGDESDWAANVHRGYRDWCTRHGVAPAVRTVPFEAPAGDVHAAGRDLLRDEPGLDALVCAPAGSAAQLLPLLRDAGRRVGTDLLLASCVDAPDLLLTEPPVTAIDLRPRRAGAACAALLFELLDGTSPPGTERVHPIELIARASTAPISPR